MKKPLVLYHASDNRHIDEFEPRAETVRSKTEGPVVFATPDRVGVTVFLTPTNDSWTRSGCFSDGHHRVNFIVINGRDRFLHLDHGGAVYELPSDTFNTDPNLGSRENEWTSRVPVRPIKQTEVESSLDEMLRVGIQVYFVDDKTFQSINQSNDHGHAVLKSLVSENQRRHLNVKQLPD